MPTERRKQYITPKETKRSIWDKILRPFNLYFYYQMVKRSNYTAQTCQKAPISQEDLYFHGGDVLKGAELAGCKVYATNLDKTTDDGQPVVFVGNHMSSLETVTMPYFLAPQKISFVVKEKLFTTPIFKHIMKSIRCIPMTRTNPAKDLKRLYKEGGELIKEGTSIIIFPQKTRGLEFIPEEFGSIGVKLARRMKVPVQPFALKTDFWELGKKISDYGPVNRDCTYFFDLGDPIEVTKENEQEAQQQCIDFIQSRLNKWNADPSFDPQELLD